jgi:hypothetical protein
MTTEKIYHCNFCRDEIKPTCGHGLLWHGQSEIDATTMSQAENHLCQRCAKALAVTLDRLYGRKPPGPPDPPNGRVPAKVA